MTADRKREIRKEVLAIKDLKFFEKDYTVYKLMAQILELTAEPSPERTNEATELARNISKRVEGKRIWNKPSDITITDFQVILFEEISKYNLSRKSDNTASAQQRVDEFKRCLKEKIEIEFDAWKLNYSETLSFTRGQFYELIDNAAKPKGADWSKFGGEKIDESSHSEQPEP